MIARPARRSLFSLALVLSALCAVVAHLAMAEGFQPRLGALVSLLPVAAVLVWLIRRPRLRLVAFAIAIAAGATLWAAWDDLERHFSGLFFVEHVALNVALAIVFGRTLSHGSEPLCTRFARAIHGGSLPPGVAGYTRQVTVAWTIFFAAIAATSCVLYLDGWIALWSAFATLLTPLLLAAMFVVEYAVRVRVLPDVERIGILGGIRAFSNHFRAAQVESPR